MSRLSESLLIECEDLLIPGVPIRTTDLATPLDSRERTRFGCR
jgi:hypothetical protein